MASPCQRAGASGVVGRDGVKVPGLEFFNWDIEDVHAGAYSIPDRLDMMDQQGIWAQIVYPNTVGFGGQKFRKVADPALRQLAVQIYNDAMADMQEVSEGRLMPMGILPFWDIDLAVAEIDPDPPVRSPWHQHHLGPTRPRATRPRHGALGSGVGGRKRSRAADQLPHRLQ